MRTMLERLLFFRVQQTISTKNGTRFTCPKIERKLNFFAKRSAEIVKTKATGEIIRKQHNPHSNETIVDYNVHLSYLIKQAKLIYMEEEIEKRQATFKNDKLIDDKEIIVFFGNCNMGKDRAVITNTTNSKLEQSFKHENMLNNNDQIKYKYNRLKAVQYAERWWNDYNPAYHKFEVDCTNYVSQCLHAGGAPMSGQTDRNKGWWMTDNNWSYSWSVAHSLRWYLANSKIGLQAKEVYLPEQLLLGDVVCYDFQGDGRYDHTTIVTGKDANGMPLVNAHTENSRMRYWSYEDSSAYTPSIKYKFFSIIDK